MFHLSHRFSNGEQISNNTELLFKSAALLNRNYCDLIFVIMLYILSFASPFTEQTKNLD